MGTLVICYNRPCNFLVCSKHFITKSPFKFSLYNYHEDILTWYFSNTYFHSVLPYFHNYFNNEITSFLSFRDARRHKILIKELDWMVFIIFTHSLFSTISVLSATLRTRGVGSCRYQEAWTGKRGDMITSEVTKVNNRLVEICPKVIC